jgi:hypothetical protein
VAAICMSLLLVITLVYQQLKENQSFAAFDFKSQ